MLIIYIRNTGHLDIVGPISFQSGLFPDREWSLFMAGGGGIPKIARTQNVPPLNNRALRVCPPSEPVHWNLAPLQRPYILICICMYVSNVCIYKYKCIYKCMYIYVSKTLWSFVSKHIIKIYHENGKCIGNILILCKRNKCHGSGGGNFSDGF